MYPKKRSINIRIPEDSVESHREFRMAARRDVSSLKKQVRRKPKLL